MRSKPNAATDGTLAGLNRDLGRAQETTKDSATEMHAYVSVPALNELFVRYRQLPAEAKPGETPHVANLVPGAFQNQSILGQDSNIMDPNTMQYEIDEKTQQPIPTNKKWILSDSNPLFQLLYQVVPGAKSASEIHDKQIHAMEAAYKDREQKIPDSMAVITIIPSILQTFVHAVGSALDVPNWGNNWEIIKPSFESRMPQQTSKQ